MVRRWQAGDSQRKMRWAPACPEIPSPSMWRQAGCHRGLSRLANWAVWPPGQDLLEPWADQIYQWLTGDRLQLTRIRELLAARGCGIVSVVAPLRSEAELATAQPDHGAHGGHRARGGGGGGLRPVGHDCGPSDGTPAGGVGADHRAGLLAALLRLADPWADAGGHHRRTGSGVGLLRRGAPLSGHRQLPANQTCCIRASPEASWNTRSTAVSSPMRRGCGNPRTSPRWSVACSTSGSVSSRAAISTACPT